jgi:hypothetical protein
MRAWLEILRERHPEVSWIAVRNDDSGKDLLAEMAEAEMAADELLAAV